MLLWSMAHFTNFTCAGEPFI